MPQIMEPDSGYTRSFAERVEVPVHVPRLDRRAVPRREDGAGLPPSLACGVFPPLGRAMLPEDDEGRGCTPGANDQECGPAAVTCRCAPGRKPPSATYRGGCAGLR